MKIRSIAELNTVLSEALGWRKRDLSALLMVIDRCNREHERAVLRRAGVPILYAHWEGFVRQAAAGYLEMVARQRLPYKQLKTNFISLCCRTSFEDAVASEKLHIQTQVVDFILLNQDERSQIPYRNVIHTRSNLSSEVLQDIFFTIGIPYDHHWKSKKLLIDGSLLRMRNEIAHGARVDIDEPAYSQLHRLVVESLDHIRDTIENSAVSRAYARQT